MPLSKHTINERRKVALENLKQSQFTEKGNRTQESWEKRVAKEIETLEKRIR